MPSFQLLLAAIVKQCSAEVFVYWEYVRCFIRFEIVRFQYNFCYYKQSIEHVSDVLTSYHSLCTRTDLMCVVCREPVTCHYVTIVDMTNKRVSSFLFRQNH